MTGDVIVGKVFWQDINCVSIVDANNEQISVWKMAIAYMKVRSDAVVERDLSKSAQKNKLYNKI
ncbi:hypothetical protein PN497_11350 [Sphaerospermopsis kisseleviana CS-549]|uniref:Hfq-related domain-containing protein n=2 Tax=Sphaerospermopsis TaxID=752201 RepID=A0ABT4ZRA0_9CYAN|nr:hypothetical protein [Sphaerospermopsis kisseleviana]MDB9441951.1 hypothetical protein [Sphaerospermopsis kisseleviana CS-549]